MSALLESYVAGTLVPRRGRGRARPRRRDRRGGRPHLEPRPRLRARMVAHARDVGGPAIRALTFHERAGLLKALAKHLGGVQGRALRAVAAHRRHPARLDGRHRRRHRHGVQLREQGRRGSCRTTPSSSTARLEPLGRGGTFVGQHLYTSRPGVAVQINAFNFPVWGMLEKLAPAFLAGPAQHRQAGQPDGVPHRGGRPPDHRVRHPARGRLQLICGSAGTLLDELGEQDSVAFTGSAHTAGILRNHPAVLHGGVRLGVEADSLNCSILGPDVTPEDPEFDLFVKGVVTEMTVKAGQKCTAIRRVIVPGGDSPTPSSTRSARGWPRSPSATPPTTSVRMGALASLAQRDEVRKAIEALRTSADVVFGDPDARRRRRRRRRARRVPLPGPAARPPRRRRAARRRAVRPGQHRAHLRRPSTRRSSWPPAARGSLVGVAGHPRPAGRPRTWPSALAPWHGRILVLDRDDAAESTGHGSPLPMLVHGGPGRAGGGEELGGIRGVLHHMQRTAIQASPDMLTAITGRWTTGSRRIARRRAPVPQEPRRAARSATPSRPRPGPSRSTDIDHFAEFTGDTFYAHTDPEAAAANPLFGGIVAHGYLVVSLAAGLFVEPEPGPGAGQLRRRQPAVPHPGQGRRHHPGDADRQADHPAHARPTTARSAGTRVVTNQDDEPVATYDVLTLVAKTTP